MFISLLPDIARYGRAPIWVISVLITLTAGPAAVRSAGPPVSAPYLVVDMPHRKIVVELGGVVLSEYAVTVLSDSSEAAELVSDLAGRKPDERIVEDVYLMSAAETISESELRIIAEETGLGADKIQRYIPGEMILVTSDGLRIYIRTDCPIPRMFTVERVKDAFRRIWHGITGGDSLRLQLSAEDAMSLYGVARSRPQITTK